VNNLGAPAGTPLLLVLMATQEGYGRAGTIPTRDNNPGDLTHSPHSLHPGNPNAIGIEPSSADGWADFRRQVLLDVERNPVLTLAGLIYDWCPPDDGITPLLKGNNQRVYLANVLAGFQKAGYSVGNTTTVSIAMEIEA